MSLERITSRTTKPPIWRAKEFAGRVQIKQTNAHTRVSGMLESQDAGWQALAAAIRAVELDDEDDNDSVMAMVPHLLSFLRQVVDKKGIVPSPDHITSSEGRGIRLDWDREGKYLSLIAHPNSTNMMKMYIHDGVTGVIISSVDPSRFIELIELHLGCLA